MIEARKKKVKQPTDRFSEHYQEETQTIRNNQPKTTFFPEFSKARVMTETGSRQTFDTRTKSVVSKRSINSIQSLSIARTASSSNVAVKPQLSKKPELIENQTADITADQDDRTSMTYVTEATGTVAADQVSICCSVPSSHMALELDFYAK